MKKRTSFIVTLVLTFLVSAFSQKTDAYAFSYTYTVSFYSGAQGTFSGAGAIQVRKVQVILRLRQLILPEIK